MSSKQQAQSNNRSSSGRPAAQSRRQSTAPQLMGQTRAAQSAGLTQQLLTPIDMLQLQRTIGNRAVGRLVHQRQQQTIAGSPSTSSVIQAKWMSTDLNKDYYQWDTVLSGLRWFASKKDDAMYFIVVNPNEENKHLIDLEGVVKSYEDWASSGLFQLIAADNSIVEEQGQQIDTESLKEEPYEPYIFRPVGHKFNQDSSRFNVITGHYNKRNNQQFENDTGSAKTKPRKLEKGEINLGLADLTNIGRYVFHLTTIKNILLDPATGSTATSILGRGLDPSKGGGKGGACETCIVLNDQKMFDGSRENSKGVVAITTSHTNIKMYANQRVEHNTGEFAKGRMTMRDLLLRESILLRFKLTQPHVQNMEIDPQHPNDDTVRLIRGISISPQEIEALTSDGWQSIEDVGRMLYTIFKKDVSLSQYRYDVAKWIDGMDPKRMHQFWKSNFIYKAQIRNLVLNNPREFPNFFRHIFHRQRAGRGGLAGYALS